MTPKSRVFALLFGDSKISLGAMSPMEYRRSLGLVS